MPQARFELTDNLVKHTKHFIHSATGVESISAQKNYVVYIYTGCHKLINVIASQRIVTTVQATLNYYQKFQLSSSLFWFYHLVMLNLNVFSVLWKGSKSTWEIPWVKPRITLFYLDYALVPKISKIHKNQDILNSCLLGVTLLG